MDQVCAVVMWLVIVSLFLAYSFKVLIDAWDKRTTPEQSLRFLEVNGRPDLDIFPNLVNC